MFKIYVGNLDYSVTAEQVNALFASHCQIEDVAIATDKETGKSRGFAIVMVRDEQQGKKAIVAMNGKKHLGRLLVVDESGKGKKRPAEPPLVETSRTQPTARQARGDRPIGAGSRNPRRNPGTSRGRNPRR